MVALTNFSKKFDQNQTKNNKEIHLFTIAITLQRDNKHEVSLYINGDINTSVITDSRKDIKQCIIDMIKNMDFERVDEV